MTPLLHFLYPFHDYISTVQLYQVQSTDDEDIIRKILNQTLVNDYIHTINMYRPEWKVSHYVVQCTFNKSVK